jgi:hypothetical protein
MIIHSYTEKEILSELICDYKTVKQIAKKKADKFLLKARKNGRFIRETYYEGYHITTKLNNKWYISIEYDQTNKIPWLFKATCMVEGLNKSKDYYIVRGLNTERPYFVKVTTHALKRNRERNQLDKIMNIPLEIIACNVFEHRETAICQRYVDIKYVQLIHKMDDADALNDEMSYIFLTNRGVYFGKVTPEKNYVFKTYVSAFMGVSELVNVERNKNTKWEKEGSLIYYMFHMHQYFNKNLWDKDMLEKYLYANVGEDTELDITDEASLYIMRP